MFFLILAIFSSAMVAIIMRTAQTKVSNPTGLLAGNYIVCVLMGLLLSVPEIRAGAFPGFPFSIGLGILNGGIYLGSFALMQWSTRQNGVVLSSMFMKLGVLVSTLISIVFFREIPTLLQVLGFFLAVCSILIINYTPGVAFSRSSWVLIVMLVVSGLTDVMSKIYEVFGNAALENTFLLFTFFSALCLCLVFMKRKQEHLGKQELFYGALLGIPNFLSSLFLLKALSSVPAMIAFPTFNVAVILIVAFAGMLLFRERLSRKQAAGGLLICIALVLLNL